tara:strand:+ start:30535 stop:31527 length:993 start_codon:yes stop_codon:yes gene_type:complete
MKNKKRHVDGILIDALEKIAPHCLQQDVRLSEISSYKIGGLADLVIAPENVDMAANVIKYLNDQNVLYAVIGDTSNVLFDDAGYRGVLLRVSSAFNTLEFGDDGYVRAGAGLWVPCFVRNVIARGLAGCVHAIGIPGRLGGLVIMNGGSQRKGIGEQLESVTIIDAYGSVQILGKEECRFDYRSSYLQDINCLVVEACFRYDKGNVRELHREGLDILIERRLKFPRQYPNCGSVFLSNPSMYPLIGAPGKAIEDVGLKGARRGDAQISPLHGNFIINHGAASSQDVLRLIHQCRHTVVSKTGFEMDCEVQYLSPDGAFQPAHIAADRMGV